MCCYCTGVCNCACFFIKTNNKWTELFVFTCVLNCFIGLSKSCVHLLIFVTARVRCIRRKKNFTRNVFYFSTLIKSCSIMLRCCVFQQWKSLIIKILFYFDGYKYSISSLCWPCFRGEKAKKSAKVAVWRVFVSWPFTPPRENTTNSRQNLFRHKANKLVSLY